MFWKRLDYKYYFIIVLSYTLLLTLAIGCIFTQSDQIYKQLDFYNDNPYRYTYEFSTAVGQNDYMKCSSVYFYSDNNTSRSLHGDCLMQLVNSDYNQNSPLQTSVPLGKREIAISYNLAQKHGLTVGSVIYSNHNIKNKTEAYTVTEILPVCYGVLRVDFDINYGVIVMGYDEDYHKNTDYSYIAFFEDDPYKTLQLDGVGLIDINAKETFTETMMQKVIVWQSIILLGVAGITLLYAIVHWKYQKKYYARLMLLGFQTYKRKQHILLDMILPGVAGLVIALLFSTVLHTLRNMFVSYTTAIISISFGCLILLITSLIITFSGRKI